jgi:Tfp pilus assembly protein PilN
MRKYKQLNWKAALVAILVTALAWAAWNYLSTRTNQARLQKTLGSKQIELDHRMKELNNTKASAQQLEQAKKELEEQKKDLEKQLQAKRDSAVAYAAALPRVVDGCGDNKYAHFIYMHESGCNLSASNSIGCRGIGQACPGGKLPCTADYACQNAWFTNYAIKRYGSWANAYAFWLQHSWW